LLLPEKVVAPEAIRRYSWAMLFSGWIGIAVSLGILIVTWLIVWLRTAGYKSFTFDPHGTGGSFEKVLGPYLDIGKFVLGLAAGAIVLVIGSSVFGGNRHLPAGFASPLFLLALSIIYGILFMVFLVFNYEGFTHDKNCYTRFRYVRNQALGFGSLACFCVGYAWLIVAATE
jgi:hypothetical protein